MSVHRIRREASKSPIFLNRISQNFWGLFLRKKNLLRLSLPKIQLSYLYILQDLLILLYILFFETRIHLEEKKEYLKTEN